jgi:hypothetical protein
MKSDIKKTTPSRLRETRLAAVIGPKFAETQLIEIQTPNGLEPGIWNFRFPQKFPIVADYCAGERPLSVKIPVTKYHRPQTLRVQALTDPDKSGLPDVNRVPRVQLLLSHRL